jgi:hypothetical protein
VWVWVSSRACSARTLTNLSPSCNRWETFELPKKVFGGICVYLWVVFENWLWWLVMNLCAYLGCFWRLIAMVGNEFVATLGCFWRLIAVVGNEFELESKASFSSCVKIQPSLEVEEFSWMSVAFREHLGNGRHICIQHFMEQLSHL